MSHIHHSWSFAGLKHSFAIQILCYKGFPDYISQGFIWACHLGGTRDTGMVSIDCTGLDAHTLLMFRLLNT